MFWMKGKTFVQLFWPDICLYILGAKQHFNFEYFKCKARPLFKPIGFKATQIFSKGLCAKQD